MIVDERITSYIHSLDQGNTQLLTQIEREARADLVPIIRQETASFLKVLLRMQPAEKHSGGGNRRRFFGSFL